MNYELDETPVENSQDNIWYKLDNNILLNSAVWVYITNWDSSEHWRSMEKTRERHRLLTEKYNSEIQSNNQL